MGVRASFGQQLWVEGGLLAKRCRQPNHCGPGVASGEIQEICNKKIIKVKSKTIQTHRKLVLISERVDRNRPARQGHYNPI
jgi:hypothetical protein